jgi:hypothetical protein
VRIVAAHLVKPVALRIAEVVEPPALQLRRLDVAQTHLDEFLRQRRVGHLQPIGRLRGKPIEPRAHNQPPRLIINRKPMLDPRLGVARMLPNPERREQMP